MEKMKCFYCGKKKKVEDFSVYKRDAKIGTCWDCFYSEPKPEPKPEPEFTESPLNGDLLQIVELRKVINGEVFKRTPDAKTVYVRNHYDKSSRSFSASDFEDMNREIFIKADKKVYVGFTY